jgi:Putative Ig domain
MRTTMTRVARAAQAAAVSLGLLLAACGGGGGYGGGTPPPPPAPSALSYTSPAATTVGVAMTALNPTVTGTVTSYSVSPALPAGIAINTTSGAITGTPTAVTAQATYTITATNATGSTTFALALKVDPPPPSAFTLSPLVSDGSVTAPATDAHLKNPWGMAVLPGGPMWVANNHDLTSTIYEGTGLVQALVVSIPSGVNGVGNVTGMVSSTSTSDQWHCDSRVAVPLRNGVRDHLGMGTDRRRHACQARV